MPGRRYIGIVVSILLMVAIILVFANPAGSLRRDIKKIILRDQERIDRIQLTDSYDSTVLVRQGDQWFLFGEERANQAPVHNLLFAAERIQITSVLSDQQKGDLPRPREITFFQGKQRKLGIHLFQVGNRHIISRIGSDHAYYVNIPGFSGLNLGRVFSSSANHYRQHILIDLLPSDISSIRVKRKDGAAYRFQQDPEGNLSCTGRYQGSQVDMEMLDELSVRLLLSYFTSIRYEKRSGIAVNELAGPDDIMQPEATLTVESHTGEKHTLAVYPYHEQPDGDAHMFKALVAYNEEPEALLVNYIYLDVLTRDLSHYFAGKE
jgi:hypothetical protein